MNMNFNPEQNNQQNKKDSSDILVPRQGVEEFYVENNPEDKIRNCKDLISLSNILSESKSIVSDTDFLTEEEIQKVLELCRDAQFALNKESIEKFLARQDEVPEAFGLREKYVELVTEKFNMHPTLH